MVRDIFCWVLLLIMPSAVELSVVIGVCNGDVDWVPGGVVCIGGLASEGVLAIWFCR